MERIAIVTGGTGELGRIIVSKFAEVGIKVYVPARNIDKFREIFDNSNKEESEFKLRKIYGLSCDAEKEKDVKQFVADVFNKEGRIDYLINTVGGCHPKKNIVDMDWELIDKMMNLNFKTTFYFCKYVLKHMIEKNFGRIAAIGAMHALEPSPGKLAYSVSKSNVINLMLTIAEEYKANNITANVIVPSIIDTPENRKSMHSAGGPDKDFSKLVSQEEIAETILFLISDNAKSFNGNIIKMFGRD